MTDTALTFTPAWRLKELIATKQVSPVELAEVFLRRIEALDSRLNAYLTVTADQALAQARASEKRVMQGRRLRLVEGIPISVKDLMFTQGVRTTSGSLLFKDFVPERDAIVVERVKRAGAVILGKTNTPEFGLSATTENHLGDACRNPWDTNRTSGGSSGGAAAATVAGLCSLSIGSDGGGSIRIPASFCGIYGLKPTRGRVARHGGLGGFPLFSTIGPMTRTVRDSALLLQVLAGPDNRDPTSIKRRPPNFLLSLGRGVKGLRFAWSTDLGYAAVEPEVVEVTSRAAHVFQEMGATVEEANVSLDAPSPHFWDIAAADSYSALGQFYEQQRELLTDYTLKFMEHGRRVTGVDYSRSFSAVLQLQAQMEEPFKRYDILLTPTMPIAAFPVGKQPETIAGRKIDPFWEIIPFTYPFNMTGQPAATVPCGFTASGLPIGLHIIGRAGDEATVLRASAAFEEVRPWAARRPPVS